MCAGGQKERRLQEMNGSPMPSVDAGPLKGVRILDLTRVVSGPFATMQLGDLGAEVAKVEQPGSGDDSRAFGPPFLGGESAYFLSINRNKRACIDLKSEAGKDLLLHLASAADVVVENFRPGTLERLGLGFETLSRTNPRLILCSITGFGRSGPEADRPGYDLIIQGESGIMDITGEAGGPPTKVGTSIADMVSGLYAAQAILAALIKRDRSGRGERLDVSMLDAMASLLTFNAGIYFATGKSPARRGSAHATISPYEPYEAADGWINVGVANDKFWKLFCSAIGKSELLSDSRLAKAPHRVVNREALPHHRRGVRGAAACGARRRPKHDSSDRRPRATHRKRDPLRRRAPATCTQSTSARRAQQRNPVGVARAERIADRTLRGARSLWRVHGTTLKAVGA
jgi:crotonobetainyl-CoA:carnitine CoA-transferase CaiB-like acyl-CoA transferase